MYTSHYWQLALAFRLRFCHRQGKPDSPSVFPASKVPPWPSVPLCQVNDKNINFSTFAFLGSLGSFNTAQMAICVSINIFITQTLQIILQFHHCIHLYHNLRQ